MLYLQVSILKNQRFTKICEDKDKKFVAVPNIMMKLLKVLTARYMGASDALKLDHALFSDEVPYNVYTTTSQLIRTVFQRLFRSGFHHFEVASDEVEWSF